MHNYVHDKMPQKTFFLKICKILKTVESQLCKTRHCFATSTTATRLSKFENEPMTNVNTYMIPELIFFLFSKFLPHCGKRINNYELKKFKLLEYV